MRDESRGSHFKPEFPKRDDEKFLKTTIASYDAAANHGPKISYEDVDVSLVKPVLRDYTGKGAPTSTPPAAPQPAEQRVTTKPFGSRSSGRTQPDAAPRWEEFEVPWEERLNVHAALMAIQRQPRDRRAGSKTTPVVWDANCLEEVCGSCTMLINGRVMQACSALVDQLEQPIELRPMTKYPLIRDLAVDRTRIFDDFKRVHAWIDIDGTYDIGPGPRTSPELAEIALRSVALHGVRLLHGGLPELRAAVGLRRRGADLAGAPVEPAPVGGDARGRAARGADGAGRHGGLRQRAELRAGVPEGDSADDVDRRHDGADDEVRAVVDLPARLAAGAAGGGAAGGRHKTRRRVVAALIIENSSPTTPITIKIMPTMCRSTPETRNVTAQ